VDAVLQRDNCGPRPDDRAQPLPDAFDVPQFDAEQHQIDGADFGEVIRRLRRADVDLAAVPHDAQPVLADRREMRATRDKDDVRPGRRERRAIRSADPARADHRDAHGASPHTDRAALDPTSLNATENSWAGRGSGGRDTDAM